MKKLINIFWNPNEKRLRMLIRLGLFALIYLLISMLVTIVFRSLEINVQITQFWVSALLQLATTLVVVFISGKLIDSRPFASFGFHFSVEWWRDCFFGVALGALLMTSIFLFEWVMGWITIEGFLTSNALENKTSLISIVYQLLGSLILFISVGTYEELLIRGYLMKNLTEGLNHPKIKSTLPLILSALITSFLFGILHVVNPNASFISTINISLTGIFLSLGIMLKGELSIPIGFHFAWNFFQGIVFGFPVSGFIAPFKLFNIRQRGFPLITGGNFGPEAGFIGLAAILIGSILTLLRERKILGKITLNNSYANYGNRPTIP